jgi:two-component system sensor histidine kinase UhpB
LGELKNHTTEPPYLESQIGELRSQLQVLGADVHRISHELHPAKLTQLGLEAALRGFCREISEAHGLHVDFEATKLSSNLDNDLSLCFYRVAQEALQNVVKHADATRADVRIEVAGDELILEIYDNGKGFDIGSVSEKGSLGLVSISERMRAVAGTSKVLTSPGRGTTVEARAPLSAVGAVSAD